MSNEINLDNILRRSAKREALEKKIKYEQAKEKIFENVGKTEGMENYIQIVRMGDYDREEREKLDSTVFTLFLIGVPTIFLILTWQPIYWIVIFFLAIYLLMGHFSEQ